MVDVDSECVKINLLSQRCLIAISGVLVLSGDLSAEPSVEVSDVSVQFGSFLALDNLSLRVMPGDVFGC